MRKDGLLWEQSTASPFQWFLSARRPGLSSACLPCPSDRQPPSLCPASLFLQGHRTDDEQRAVFFLSSHFINQTLC